MVGALIILFLLSGKFDDSINNAQEQFQRHYNWLCYIEALSFVESRNNDSIIGKSNDVGRYQITPIYVKEVNRILKNDVYTLDDRYNMYKCVNMIYIMNKKYNPTLDVEKAIHLHNPHAPKSYKQKILKRIKNQEYGR